MSLQTDTPSAALAQALYFGQGTAFAQHGELFQGVVRDGENRLHRSCLAFPAPSYIPSANSR